MKAATKYLLLKLIGEKKESYEKSIYSLNISQVEGYQKLIRRHQKKITELDNARNDLIGGRDNP